MKAVAWEIYPPEVLTIWKARSWAPIKLVSRLTPLFLPCRRKKGKGERTWDRRYAPICVPLTKVYMVEAKHNWINTEQNTQSMEFNSITIKTYQSQLILQRFDRKQQWRSHGFEVQQQQAVKTKHKLMQTKYNESMFCTQFFGYQRLIDVFLTDHAKNNSGTQGILILPQLKQETRILPSGIAKYCYIFLGRQK